MLRLCRVSYDAGHVGGGECYEFIDVTINEKDNSILYTAAVTSTDGCRSIDGSEKEVMAVHRAVDSYFNKVKEALKLPVLDLRDQITR